MNYEENQNNGQREKSYNDHKNNREHYRKRADGEKKDYKPRRNYKSDDHKPFNKKFGHKDFHHHDRESSEELVKKAQLGEVSNFEVNRITDLGFMLVDEGNYGKVNSEEINSNLEYFLHNNESQHRDLHLGDKVKAFLYLDKQKRLAATLATPLATTKKSGLCEVVSVNETGAYVNIGISKDILFSSDEYDNDTCPQVKKDQKTKLPCRLRVRGNNLFIKLLSKNDMIPLKDGTTYNKGDEVTGYVYRITGEGINLVDEHFNVIFIHKTNIRKGYHLGEEVKCIIIGSTEEDYYGSTILTKDSFIQDETTTIINYLKEHNGVMNYSSNTDPDIIVRVFNMSKKSFKIALGNLYKERKVILEENRTILVRENN